MTGAFGDDAAPGLLRRGRRTRRWECCRSSRAPAAASISSRAGNCSAFWKAGGDPSRVVLSGVGKTAAEIEFALRRGICNLNCESEAELGEIDAIAQRLGLIVARFCPARESGCVDAVTHPYISTGLRDHKFGIDIEEAPAIYHRAKAYPESAGNGGRLPHRIADSGLFFHS